MSCCKHKLHKGSDCSREVCVSEQPLLGGMGMFWSPRAIRLEGSRAVGSGRGGMRLGEGTKPGEEPLGACREPSRASHASVAAPAMCCWV